MAENTLRGKVVVITGASSGFGKGAAREFALAGAHLVLAARRDALLDELARECTHLGVRAIAVPTDVSEPADVRALFEAAIMNMGHIDVWVNNAGVGAIGRFEDIPLADHEQLVRTNLLGVIYGSWHAYQHFLERKQGTLINIASELGKTSVPYFSSYTAAKHGVVGLSASIRQELMQNEVDNVHVCCIMPTAHDTPFFDHAANYTGHATEPPQPLHDPKEVVDTIVRLARNPKDETIVGSDGHLKFLMAHLARPLAEVKGAKQMHKVAIENPPPAPPKRGAVQEPMAEGTGVSAGRRDQPRKRAKASAEG
jgi:short-subunit dehydrogenase